MFRKKSYSDLEVQEILGLLNLEKKKVSELTSKLKNSHPEEAVKGKESQLEVIVQFMRKRLDEAQGENLELQNKIAEANKLTLRYQIEAEQHLAAFEHEKKKNVEFNTEENALKEQFNKLKEQIKSLEEEKKSWSTMADEAAILKAAMQDLNAQNSAVQKELDDLNELFQEKEQRIRHLTLEIEEKSSALENKNTAHLELTKFTEDLQSKLMQAETLREEAIQNIEEERHENEACLKAAQTHLGKKVREAAILAEKYEGAQKQIEQLEKEKESSVKKLSSVQALLDAELQHKLKVEQQHLENIKTLEAQSGKWEEKYFKLHDKWQEVEGKNRELKRLEERFSKMQIAFSQFNQLFASPFTLTQTEEIPLKSFEMEPASAQEMSAAFIQPSLFQTPKPPPRYKETLFG